MIDELTLAMLDTKYETVDDFLMAYLRPVIKSSKDRLEIADYIIKEYQIKHRDKPSKLIKLFYELNHHGTWIDSISESVKELESKPLSDLCGVNSTWSSSKLPLFTDDICRAIYDRFMGDYEEHIDKLAKTLVKDYAVVVDKPDEKPKICDVKELGMAKWHKKRIVIDCGDVKDIIDIPPTHQWRNEFFETNKRLTDFKNLDELGEELTRGWYRRMLEKSKAEIRTEIAKRYKNDLLEDVDVLVIYRD